MPCSTFLIFHALKGQAHTWRRAKTVKCDTTKINQNQTRSSVFKMLMNGRFACQPSNNCSVNKVTGYGLDDRGVRVRVPVGSRTFSSSNRPDRLCGPHNLLPNGYRGLPPPGGGGVKRPGREADHSPPTSAEVKKIWIWYISSPIRLHGVVLKFVEHRDNSTLP
jgi:hypothetical protein